MSTSWTVGGLVLTIGVLDKVVAILDSFGEGSEAQDPAQVAARLGLSRATTYRLMAAMGEHRLLQPQGRSYRLGTKLLELSAQAHTPGSVAATAARRLGALRDRTGETVEVHQLVGHRRIPVEMRISSRTVRAMSQLGVPLPIHVGASGRVLLMDVPDEQALLLARDSAADFGSIDWDESTFLQRLHAARDQGWAFSRGERDPETAGVAAAIRDCTGAVVAALVASSTGTRFANEAHRSEVLAEVRAVARTVSAELGHRDPASSPTATTELPA
jgi:IclR family acetate operon transcriptional repressor